MILNMSMSKDDFYGFGFEIDANHFRNEVENYAHNNALSSANGEVLKPGRLEFMEDERKFEDINSLS